VGSAQGVDLSALQQLIKQALHILREYVPKSVETEAQVHQSSPVERTETPAVVTSAPHVCDGEIHNRHDVVRNLDRILGYYARHEPSSPLPVLLNRAKNLVHADFAAIVRNLIPDGMPQFENLRGPDLE
jgi:type VI secretion system protein ImpA